MRSPAAAFAWEFRRRLRSGLFALVAYLLLLAAVQLLAGPRSSIRPSNEVTFAFTVTLPLTAAFFHLLAVFSYGLAGDLTARQSMYPARLFTLPVTTAALAGYPMLYGSLAMAGLWAVADLAALRASGAPGTPCLSRGPVRGGARAPWRRAGLAGSLHPAPAGRGPPPPRRSLPLFGARPGLVRVARAWTIAASVGGRRAALRARARLSRPP